MSNRALSLAALLAAALVHPVLAEEAQLTGVVELADGDEHQPNLLRIRLRTADGDLYSLGGSPKDEPGFYANFAGREITVRGELRPAPAWSDGVPILQTATRESDEPGAPFLERAPMISPALSELSGVVSGEVLLTEDGELTLVGPVAPQVVAATGRRVTVRGYAFPAERELFVVAVQGTVRSASRYRNHDGSKKLQLAMRGRSVWVQGTAAGGAPADSVKNIPVRPSPEGAEDLLLVDKELLTEWTPPGIGYACVIPVIQLWWSKTTFLAYVGKYLPSASVEIGREVAPVKGISALGR